MKCRLVLSNPGRLDWCIQGESLIEAIPLGHDFGKWPNNRHIGQRLQSHVFGKFGEVSDNAVFREVRVRGR
jgi:hypothetical protein